MLTIRAHATSANLGPGFDCLGMELDVANVLRAEASERLEIDVHGEGAEHLPRDETNVVYRAACLPIERRGLAPPAMRLVCENHIPTARGLGSSSAARVSGLLLGNAILAVRGQEWTRDELLAMAVGLEGHADNVAACLLGGIQVSVLNGGHVATCPVEPAVIFDIVLYIPDQPMETEAARRVIPRQVSLETAVHNIGRSSLLVAALTAGRPELLALATDDALHQPPRAAVFPQMPLLIAAAREAGAYGAFLSGAGSTILALTAPERADDVEAGLASRAAELGVAGRTVRTRPTRWGATVAGHWPAGAVLAPMSVEVARGRA